MKILIAPLNWGLGHATRCIPLIRQFLNHGDEVVLGGDGESLVLLKKHFPNLRQIDLPSLELRYMRNKKQRGFYLRAIPALLRFAIADHYYLNQQLATEHFDLVISDNRFGLFSKQVKCVYITHQLYVRLPQRLKFIEPFARALHAYIYKRYNEVWVPDYSEEQTSLAGKLCHGGIFDHQVKYIGPLSRLASSEGIPKGYRRDTYYQIVAILSGLEPQRSMFEQELLHRFSSTSEPILLIQGKPSGPQTMIRKGNITIIPSISDAELIDVCKRAKQIIARSGYSTLMDLEVLGVLHKAELYPTPGQSEQEYLAKWIQEKSRIQRS
jgi:uncharacterized protein (TIGR00661 family)